MRTYCWKCPTCGHKEELAWSPEMGHPVCRGPSENVMHASTICIRDYRAEAVQIAPVSI